MKATLKCRDCGNAREVFPSQAGLRYKYTDERYRCRKCWDKIRKESGSEITRATRERVICKQCGKEKLVLRGRASANYLCFYCSKHKPRTDTKVDLRCPSCGFTRSMKKSQAERRSGYCKTCSRKGERSGAWSGGKVTIQCKSCGVERLVSLSRASKQTSGLCGHCFQNGRTGEDNPAWKGGISFEPYPLEWNIKFRATIWKRDRNTCQICGIVKGQGPAKRFSVHHINYTKDDLDYWNLVLVCNSCHTKTNYRRDYWIKFFAEWRIAQQTAMSA